MLRYSVPVTLLDFPPPKIANPIINRREGEVDTPNTLYNSIADPERFEADPERFEADPEPTFYFDADSDQNFT